MKKKVNALMSVPLAVVGTVGIGSYPQSGTLQQLIRFESSQMRSVRSVYSEPVGAVVMPEKFVKTLAKFSDLIGFDPSLKGGRYVINKAKDPIPVAVLFAFIEEGWSDQEIADSLGDIAPEDVRRVRDFIFEIL